MPASAAPSDEPPRATSANEPTAPTATHHAAVPRAVHFILLHHGYHGHAQDLHYLCQLGEEAVRQRDKACASDAAAASSVAPPQFVFVLPQGSNGFQTDDGVWACARRFTEIVCHTVAATIAQVGWGRCVRSTGSAVDLDEADAAAMADTPPAAAPATDAMRELHFSAVGHSMGGLVLRAALPELMRRLEAAHGPLAPLPCTFHWDVFCTLATPHLGVRYMRSPLMTFLGHHVGHHLMTAVADLFLKNSLIRVDLVAEASLSAWARFRRRVLINVVNDGTVLTHSSSFVVPLHVLSRVGAPLPPDTASTSSSARTPAGASAPPLPTPPSAPASAQPRLDSYSTSHMGSHQKDHSVLHLAQHGIACATSLEELRDNAVMVESISPELWPLGVLQDERVLAQIILRRVGPLELHLVDFRPRRERLVKSASSSSSGGDGGRMGRVARAMTHLGATRFGHAAMVCKRPFTYPDLFGFVFEYIAADLLGMPLNDAARAAVQTEAQESAAGVTAAMPDAAEAAALAVDVANA